MIDRDTKALIAKGLAERVRGLESELALVCEMLAAIKAASEGEEPSDFMMSFPIVRAVYELWKRADCYVI